MVANELIMRHKTQHYAFRVFESCQNLCTWVLNFIVVWFIICKFKCCSAFTTTLYTIWLLRKWNSISCHTVTVRVNYIRTCWWTLCTLIFSMRLFMLFIENALRKEKQVCWLSSTIVRDTMRVWVGVEKKAQKRNKGNNVSFPHWKGTDIKW